MSHEVRKPNKNVALSMIDLHVNEVTVAYNNGHVALFDATFDLNASTICALVGVNGSGKSTLFKTIMGFLTPTRGSVTIGGKPVQAAQKKNLVAYIPQAEDVDWAFPVSVLDVVLMGRYGYMSFLRIPRAIDREIAIESLRRVNMLEYQGRQIGELSGGQKKRVFLARALAQQGRIVLLDEPFTGVDVQTEAAIIELLRELRDEGHLILVSTHDLGLVPSFCDQVVIINRTVLAAGPTHDTFTQDNLARAFGGTLRDLRLDHTDIPGEGSNEFRVLSDDEEPLVFGHDGRLVDHWHPEDTEETGE